VSFPLPILVRSSPYTKIAPTTYLCAPWSGSPPKKNLPPSLNLSLYKMFDKPTGITMRDWISEDERYDPQCQDVEQERCSCCHELVPADELKHFFGGDQV